MQNFQFCGALRVEIVLTLAPPPPPQSEKWIDAPA